MVVTDVLCRMLKVRVEFTNPGNIGVKCNRKRGGFHHGVHRGEKVDEYTSFRTRK